MQRAGSSPSHGVRCLSIHAVAALSESGSNLFPTRAAPAQSNQEPSVRGQAERQTSDYFVIDVLNGVVRFGQPLLAGELGSGPDWTSVLEMAR